MSFTSPYIIMKYKICTSITTTDFNDALRLINRNRMVELRLDLMQMSSDQISQLIQQSTETVATFREGKYSESERQEALIKAISHGATYVDIEVESDKQYREPIIKHAKQHGCKVIISYHNFESTPDNAALKNIIRQCQSLGADIVKLITTANSAADSARILSLYESEQNLVAFAMGEEGKISRFACLFLGAPFTYASAAKGSEAAPGQLTAQDLEQMIKLIQPSETKLFAVAGNPILHSRSPILFNGAYPTYDYAYFRLAAESGKEIIQLFKELGLSGINITAPFKAEMAKLADYCSEEVSVLQAANSLVEKNGKLHAFNTDIYGVTGSLEREGITIEGKNCIVLGAGGAGCAAAYALKKAGANVTIVNRTIDKAKVFAEKIGCDYSGLDKLEELVNNTSILVSTLTSNADVVEEQWLNPQLVILDAVYHGSQLKQKAKNRGCQYIDGNQWLLNQGIPGYKMFTGINPDENGMSATLSSIARIPKHVSFIGFMGTGKTTVAPMVAKMLGIPVVDVDRELESRYKESVPQMIKNKGEAYFREREQEILKELLNKETPSVISCGGGVITQPEMCELLKKDSIVICLYAPPSECLKRINIESRPLLAQYKDPQKAAEEIFEKRKALYLETAWLLVNTSGRSKEQVSKIVYDEISKCIGS